MTSMTTVRHHNKSSPGTFPSPHARFSQVHPDFVGPLPPSNGFTHLLTCVDRYTRWAEAIPLPNMEADTIVKAFVSRWIAVFAALYNYVSLSSKLLSCPVLAAQLGNMAHSVLAIFAGWRDNSVLLSAPKRIFGRSDFAPPLKEGV
ncbi:unnamed protein product [Schistocephalus solidus]|uniref:Integrase catalytic domain-containing protein n=1 Tax=Schistocephalus solidus TaxID=70667 RepID=A0A183TD07_SCHSO|nr:unnamed protein product [Schistocephalus solidus]